MFGKIPWAKDVAFDVPRLARATQARVFGLRVYKGCRDQSGGFRGLRRRVCSRMIARGGFYVFMWRSDVPEL